MKLSRKALAAFAMGCFAYAAVLVASKKMGISIFMLIIAPASLLGMVSAMARQQYTRRSFDYRWLLRREGSTLHQLSSCVPTC